eukprot:TRINITY_DN6292_c0_g2_i1.p1 TRINITY_DN6292_c0_g2~~TRINITY_DN6292_c0_g2_i1.p1  ORF type:complete len:219 (-),score=48.36 TRINITY_DN6292_c0_g2_i1:106-762(-)
MSSATPAPSMSDEAGPSTPSPNRDAPNDTETAPAPPPTEGESGEESSMFDCNICLEESAQPVITMCGHLYCWPCVYRWMHMRNTQPACPVCKTPITTDKLIPLYGRGKENTDPRARPPEDIPSRPQGHNEPPPQQNNQYGWGGFGGAPVAAGPFGGVSFGGVGLFPSLFGLQFQAFPTPGQGAGGFFNLPADQEPPQGLLSRVLFMFSVFVLFFLIFF